MMNWNVLKWLLLICFEVLLLVEAQTENSENLKEEFLIKRPEKLHFRQLLISFEGCIQASSKRSREEARQEIEAIIQRLRGGERFDHLCYSFSDHPSKNTLGVMPYFYPGEQLSMIEEALLKSPIGPQAPIMGPIETPYGFHLIQRLGLQKLFFGQILLGHEQSIPPQKRTRGEATQLAQKLLREIQENQISFERAATLHSEGDMTKKRMGYLGELEIGFLPPQVEWVLLRTPFDSVAQDIVETSSGIHLFKRYRSEKIRIRHLLFSYKEAQTPMGSPKISKQQAYQLAREAKGKLIAGTAFEELAKQNPDDSSLQGGDLGFFSRQDGFFQNFSIFTLQIQEISEPMESPVGIHLIQRTE